MNLKLLSPKRRAKTQTHPTVSSEIELGVSTPLANRTLPADMISFWEHPVLIARNRFVHKSLSSWACNFAVGCGHACRFCYVPDASARKLAPLLRGHGVTNPDSEWGDYVLVRPFDEKKFLASLRAAEATPAALLNPDGNRAVFFCSTTDAYQVIRHPDPARRKVLQTALRFSVRQALKLILEQSTLNVRILTRSPFCRQHFDLFRAFGNRLLLGMSIPTLDNRITRIYEPHAPAPSQRLATLLAAKKAGLHVYVAVAPTFPECDEADLRKTLAAVSSLDPVTIFSEPINIRADNASRIAAHARSMGAKINMSVFSTTEAWQRYAISALQSVEFVARELGIAGKLHLWPDATLGTVAALKRVKDPLEHSDFLLRYWDRVSEWPGRT